MFLLNLDVASRHSIAVHLRKRALARSYGMIRSHCSDGKVRSHSELVVRMINGKSEPLQSSEIVYMYLRASAGSLVEPQGQKPASLARMIKSNVNLNKVVDPSLHDSRLDLPRFELL